MISIYQFNGRSCGPVTSPAAGEVPQNQALEVGTYNIRFFNVMPQNVNRWAPQSPNGSSGKDI